MDLAHQFHIFPLEWASRVSHNKRVLMFIIYHIIIRNTHLDFKRPMNWLDDVRWDFKFELGLQFPSYFWWT